MIFTIGHSNRTIAEFVAALKSRGVTKLVDVRSNPYSKVPWFNGPAIQQWAETFDLFYVQEGSILGGRSPLQTTDAAFQSAVERLLQSQTRDRVAIMCAEGDPSVCHRSLKVAKTLLVDHGLVARDILRCGGDQDVTTTLEAASKSANSLFSTI